MEVSVILMSKYGISIIERLKLKLSTVSEVFEMFEYYSEGSLDSCAVNRTDSSG